MELLQIQISELYNDLLKKGFKPIFNNEYEVLECPNIQILTYGNKYVDLVWLSRHKTTKHLLEITISSIIGKKTVSVTTDHVCMIYTRDHFLQNTNAKCLSINDYVSIYDELNDQEIIGTISNIKDLGLTDEYVYDCEVADDCHAFYANDILIHNSQFINLQCVTKYLREKYNLPKIIRDWPQEKRQELWDIMNEFVNTNVNKFVRDLVSNYCHTNHADVLTYELEYMSDVGIYESKKHYATHKIFDEGDPTDKTKYSGIELKKAQIPKELKVYLAEIYNSVLLKNWNEADYQNYISDLYTKFQTFDVDEISFWKGYSTERQAVGFLKMQLGTTGIAKACIYYNQLLDKLKITQKYESILVGDKVRFLYIDENNPYNINCIAYKPGQYPEEFRKLFRPDYYKMFTKIILDPLKKFRDACKFDDIDPSKQAVFDIFNL